MWSDDRILYNADLKCVGIPSKNIIGYNELYKISNEYKKDILQLLYQGCRNIKSLENELKVATNTVYIKELNIRIKETKAHYSDLYTKIIRKAIEKSNAIEKKHNENLDEEKKIQQLKQKEHVDHVRNLEERRKKTYGTGNKGKGHRRLSLPKRHRSNKKYIIKQRKVTTTKKKRKTLKRKSIK